MFKVGDSVRVIKTEKLPGMEGRPLFNKGEEHTVKSIFGDSKGNQHIDVGLRTSKNYVRSYETEEILPKNTRQEIGGNTITQWCHPSRFELINH